MRIKKFENMDFEEDWMDEEPIKANWNGDIIITDPCYVFNWDDIEGKGVDIFGGNGLKKLGFTKYIWEDTIYGDWSCVTINVDTNEVLGRFCADAGLVGVFLLDEVLKYNPKYNYERDISNGALTLIKDFHGDIEYDIRDDEAYIEGTGNINFITKQRYK